MGDWEEYCDSLGMNAGSSDDYDAWINRLDRSAQEEEKTSIKKKHVIEVCEPTLNQDEMIELLISSCTEGGLDTRVDVPANRDPNAEYHLTAMDGLREGQSSELEIRIGYEDYVPASFLAQSIKLSGIPLFSNDFENGWVAWDAHDQCIKTGPSYAYQARSYITPKKFAREELHPDSKDAEILSFMKRWALSTDHGMKPLLVHQENMDEVVRKREVEIESPRTLGPDEHQKYVLAFYDASGTVRFFPLSTVVKLGIPVPTRNATYYEDKDTLYPSINAASMLAHGFLLATKEQAPQFDFFRVRERGSVFHSAIQRIEPADDLTRAYGTLDEPNPSLGLAKRIAQWAGELSDQIYVTNGGHPMEAELVTTPEMLLNAIKKLDQHGLVPQYDAWNKVVIKRKADIPSFNSDGCFFLKAS